MGDLERLAIAQAVYKAVGKIVSTKGESLRVECDRKVLNDFMLDGVDRRRLMINGQAVGTYSIKMSKPVDGVEPELVDAGKFIQWIRESDGGLDMLKRLVHSDPAKMVKLAACDGELPDGCRVRRVCEPPKVTGTLVTVKPEKVAAALGGELPGAIAGLIEGGGEDGVEA